MEFHLSCVFIPPIMQHPLNTDHVLQLLPTPQQMPTCNLCYENLYARPELMYQSVDPKFNLHISCAKLTFNWLEHFRMQERPA